MRELIVEKKFVFNVIITVILNIVFFLFRFDIKVMLWYYVIAVSIIYILVIPHELFNPKNFVMGFYFMWYGIAPLFANRYKDLANYGNTVINAYFMFIVTFSIAMLTLDYSEKKKSFTEIMSGKKEKHKLSVWEIGLLLFIYVISIGFYIHRTGGIALWMSNANDAFFSRGGSGFLYLLFEYAALLLFFFEGKKRGKLRKILLLVLCAITMYLCGSKSTMILFLFMLFSDEIIKIKLFDKKSILVGVIGISIFVFGMYIRAGQYMHSMEAIVATCLNYFDTLDEFLLLLNKHKSGFFQTIYYPINWLLLKMGVGYVGQPYYDTSIWLTSIYYPESWANGGTHQWPLEAYMYLNFDYWLGIPFVIIYFLIIGWIYIKGKRKEGVFRFICINECMTIGSHLRGGLFNYWYIYLIPFYVILIIWEKKFGELSEDKNVCAR